MQFIQVVLWQSYTCFLAYFLKHNCQILCKIYLFQTVSLSSGISFFQGKCHSSVVDGISKNSQINVIAILRQTFINVLWYESLSHAYFETTSAMRLYSSDGDFSILFLVGTLKNKSSTVIIVPWLAAQGLDLAVGLLSQYIVYVKVIKFVYIILWHIISLIANPVSTKVILIKLTL